MKDEQGRNVESAGFMQAVPDENRQDCVNNHIFDNCVPEDTSCIDCAKTKGVKCSTCMESDSLRCNFCPMVFLNKTDIGRHLQISHSEVYVSNKCIVKKSNIHKLKIDKQSKTRSLKMRIRKSSSTLKADNNYVQNGTNENHTYQCNICLKICLSFRGLTRHNVVHKNEIPIVSCMYCTQTFANDEEKQKHVSEYHRIDVPAHDTDESKIKLEQFQDTSKNESNALTDNVDIGIDWYQDHLNEQEDEKKKKIESETKVKKKRGRKSDSVAVKNETFKCSECRETFNKRSDYVAHQLTHSTSISNGIICDTCGKQFSSEELLKKHKSSSHRNKRVKVSEEEDPFRRWYVFADGQKHLKCDQCKYNSLWYHKGRFLEHYRIHTGEKPFTCDLCGKQFRTKTLLQKHVMFVHEGIKEHPCDICGRRFSDKRYMEDHRRIHTGERPYVCDLCGKTFKQSASLFIHKELHKGLRNHACEMCGKRFTTRSSLTIHIKRHVGERNFICATCAKAFVDGKHLKDHMVVHSDERPFSCELCGGRFKLMKHLKQHGRTHKRDFNV